MLVGLVLTALVLQGPVVHAHHYCRRINTAENGIFIEWNLWGDDFGTGTGGEPQHDAQQIFGCSNCNFFDGRFMINHVPMIGPTGWMMVCLHDDVNAPNLDGAWCLSAFHGTNIQEWVARSNGRLELLESTLYDKVTYHDDNYIAVDFKRPLEQKDADIHGRSTASPHFSFKNKPQLLVLMYDKDGPVPRDPMSIQIPGDMDYKRAFAINFLDRSQGQGLHVLWPNVDARECFVNTPLPAATADLSKAYRAYDPTTDPDPIGGGGDDGGIGGGGGGGGGGVGGGGGGGSGGGGGGGGGNGGDDDDDDGNGGNRGPNTNGSAHTGIVSHVWSMAAALSAILIWIA